MRVFNRFHYPDLAAAIVGGLLLIAVSFALLVSPVHPLAAYLIRYIGLLISFFGIVWYGFNWVIDYGPDAVRSVSKLLNNDD